MYNGFYSEADPNTWDASHNPWALSTQAVPGTYPGNNTQQKDTTHGESLQK